MDGITRRHDPKHSVLVLARMSFKTHVDLSNGQMTRDQNRQKTKISPKFLSRLDP
jgi:hypothetical protein